MTDLDKYIKWMCNPENYLNCSECPENRDIDGGGSRVDGPCGQQVCWVRAHCGDEV